MARFKSNKKVEKLLADLGTTEFEVAVRLLKGGYVRDASKGICEGCPTACYLAANGIKNPSVNYSSAHGHMPESSWLTPLPEPVAKFVKAFTVPAEIFPHNRS